MAGSQEQLALKQLVLVCRINFEDSQPGADVSYLLIFHIYNQLNSMLP